MNGKVAVIAGVSLPEEFDVNDVLAGVPATGGGRFVVVLKGLCRRFLLRKPRTDTSYKSRPLCASQKKCSGEPRMHAGIS